MSDDESPTTGGLQANTEYDSNNSIIEKVKSRVSSILPQTLSKWFSPNSRENSHNGSLRRRRENSDEQGENTDDTDYSGAEDDGAIAPPAKRSRLNIEQYSTETDRHGRNVNQRLDTVLLSSSPASTTRYHRKYQQQSIQTRKSGNLKFSSGDRRDSLCGFENATSSTLISQRLSERNTPESREPNEAIIIAEEDEEEDEPEAEEEDEVGELRSINLINNRRNLIWDSNENISSRRALNIPLSGNTARSHYSNLRRQSLRNTRTLAEDETHGLHSHNPTSHKVEEQEIETNDDESEVVDNSMKFSGDPRKISNMQKSLINGGIQTEEGSSSIVVQVDTASESGDSQCSNFQRPKQMSSGLLNPMGIGKSLRNSSIGNGLNFYMNLEGKKSLFSQKNMPNLLNNSTLSLNSLNRRQSFNSSLYGSTSALSDSRLLNITSPFYKGRTTYGGASAYSKYTPQMQRTLHAPVLMRPTSSLSTLSTSSNSLVGQGVGTGECSSTTSPAISNTAKRILELMNQFTTPLNDAKKMVGNLKGPPLTPHRKRFGSETDLTNSRGIRLTVPQTPYSRPTVDRQQYLGPANKELQVPSMSQLLQMKKLQSNTVKVREIANASKSILNKEKEYKLPTESQDLDSIEGTGIGNNKGNANTKHVSKMKNKVSSTRASSRNILTERETMPEVNLPEIALPFMKSVPKIDIAISKPQKSTNVTTSLKSGNTGSLILGSTNFSDNLGSSSTNNTSIFGNNKMSVGNEGSNRKALTRLPTLTEFTFSEPIAVSSTIEEIAKQQDSTGNSFKFSEPIIVNNTECKSLENFKYQPPEKSSKKEILNFGTGESSNNTNNGKFNNNSSASSNPCRQNVSQLKTGSVLDALKSPITTLSKETTSPCNTNIVTTPASGFGDIFKMSSEKWECPTCMIRNSNSKDKCEACETPRLKSLTDNKTQKSSSSSSSSLLPTIPVTNSLQNQFKANPNTWECPTCMIRNKNELNECAACNTNKPGFKTGLQTSLTFTVPKSSGNTPLASPSSTKSTAMDTGFKNIVAQQSSKWECPVCMTRNEQNISKCVCCEQPKPGSLNENAPSFSFGTPSSSKFTFGFANKTESDLKKEDENKSETSNKSTDDSSKKEDGEKPKSGFTFGISSGNTIPSVSTSTSATPAKANSSFSFGFKPVGNTEKSTDVPDTKTSGLKFGGDLSQGIGEKGDDTKNINKGFTFGSNINSISQANDNKQADKEGESNALKTITASSGLSFGQLNTPQKSSPLGTASSNVLNTTGGFAFGNSDKTNALNNVANKPTEVPSSSNPPGDGKPTFGMISSTNASSSEKPNFSFGSSSLSKSESVVGQNQNFQFGSSFSKDNSEKAESKKSLFNFGSSDVQKQQTAVSLFGSSTVAPLQKSETLSTGNAGSSLFGNANNISTSATSSTSSALTTTVSNSTFVFGKSSAPISNPVSIFGNTNNNNASSGSGNAPNPLNSSITSGESKFGIVSQNSTTQPSSLLPSTSILSNNTAVTSASALPTFGSPLIKATPSLPLGNQSSSTSFGNLGQSQSNNNNNGQNAFGSSNFANLANNNASQVANNNNTSNLSNNQPASNLFTFGAAAATVAKTESNSSFGTGAAAAKPFAFGATASAPSSSTAFIFGTSSNAPKPAEGTSIFGSVGNTTNNTANALSSFGSFPNSTQQQPQNTSSTTFGQPGGGGPNAGTGLSGGVSGSTSIFGASNLNTPAPVFGSAANPSSGFGSSSNFGTPTFGGSQTNTPTFGSSTAAPVSGFGSTFSSAEGPAAKRQDTSGGFNFGQAAQNPTGQFSFGASTNNNNNASKTPFSFPEPTTKSFNFTGNQETAPNAPFQFSSPANNIFAPTPTPGSGSSAALARRKARATSSRRIPR